jgi:hypothetical protein
VGQWRDSAAQATTRMMRRLQSDPIRIANQARIVDAAICAAERRGSPRGFAVLI